MKSKRRKKYKKKKTFRKKKLSKKKYKKGKGLPSGLQSILIRGRTYIGAPSKLIQAPGGEIYLATNEQFSQEIDNKIKHLQDEIKVIEARNTAVTDDYTYNDNNAKKFKLNQEIGNLELCKKRYWQHCPLDIKLKIVPKRASRKKTLRKGRKGRMGISVVSVKV